METNMLESFDFYFCNMLQDEGNIAPLVLLIDDQITMLFQIHESALRKRDLPLTLIKKDFLFNKKK